MGHHPIQETFAASALKVRVPGPIALVARAVQHVANVDNIPNGAQKSRRHLYQRQEKASAAWPPLIKMTFVANVFQVQKSVRTNIVAVIGRLATCAGAMLSGAAPIPMVLKKENLPWR